MLNIYQWFYKNIWPLKDKSLLVNYKEWKTIIQAPIGTWKSFLFFDGPLFSLYKSSERTIINKDSKSWETQLLFSVNDNYYLIIRKIKLTKTWKDSVKTHFYTIVKDKNFIDYLEQYKQEKIIIKNNDIFTLLHFNQVKLEDITSSFKQEKELQSNLNDILPPKDVASSTFFIQQDWDNIFEVDASSRINILKKIFGIMWIDDAKKIIDEQKRETYWMIKATWAEETFKDRFKKILENIENQKDKIDYEFEELNEIFWLQEDFDIKLDKVQKININLQDYIKENKQLIEKYVQSNEKYKLLENNIQEQEKEVEKLQEKLKNIEENIKEQDSFIENIKKIDETIKNEKISLDNINQDINSIEKKYENLQKEYENYIKKKNKIESEEENINNQKQELDNIIKKLADFEQKLDKKEQTNFDDIYDKIKQLEKNNELDIDFEKFHIEDYKPNNLKELEETFQNVIIKWKNLAEKINDLKTQKQELESNLDKFQKQTENKDKVNFFCSKIESNCPFIDKITEKIDKEDNFLKTQIEDSKEKIVKLDNQIKENEKLKTDLANYWKDNNINQVKKNIEQYYANEEEIKKLNNILHKNQEEQKKISLLTWEKKAKEEEKIKIKENIIKQEENIEKLKKDINIMIEKDYENIQQYKQKKEDIKSQIEKLENKKEDFNAKIEKTKELELERKNINNDIYLKKQNIEKLQKDLWEIKSNIKDNNIEQLQAKEDNLLNLKEEIWYFNNLVDELNKNKLELIKLKEKYGLLKDLGNIFWKELVIYVFKDYLESLESLINYFLETIVDFKLHISLDESWENLNILIKDEKWERQVQSLSWWQKNALKIWWILGINKLKNSKLLFLDETINNFDEESVQLIANKIKEFISENNIKFYMITHSQTLASTDIWNDVLDLEV